MPVFVGFGDSKTCAGVYRYGFNGQEVINEIYGYANFLDFRFRGCDPRLGRFFAVDPLASSYPELTPYQFASNTPIWAQELEGLEANYTNNGKTQSEDFGTGSNNAVSGPISDLYAEQLKYVSYGIISTQTTNTFTAEEIEKFKEVNKGAFQTDCLTAGVLGSENLTGAFLSNWRDASGNLDLENGSRPGTYDFITMGRRVASLGRRGVKDLGLGEELQKRGFATWVPSNRYGETEAIVNSSGNTGGNYSAFLVGLATGNHTMIIIYNSSDFCFQDMTNGNTYSIRTKLSQK